MTGPATSSKPLRRDAELNLARILVAARDVFAEIGYEASMEQIAARAGVGVGTLYRRFPNKEILLNAVVDAARDQALRIARLVVDEVPPGEMVFEFVRRCIAVPSCWRATIARPPWSREGASTMWARMSPLLHTALELSQRAGTVRADVEITDIIVTLMSVRAVADLCDTKVPDSSLRFLELALDGLRPGHASPGYPPMTDAEMEEILLQL